MAKHSAYPTVYDMLLQNEQPALSTPLPTPPTSSALSAEEQSALAAIAEDDDDLHRLAPRLLAMVEKSKKEAPKAKKADQVAESAYFDTGRHRSPGVNGGSLYPRSPFPGG